MALTTGDCVVGFSRPKRAASAVRLSFVSLDREPEKNARGIGILVVHVPAFFGDVRADQGQAPF